MLNHTICRQCYYHWIEHDEIEYVQFFLRNFDRVWDSGVCNCRGKRLKPHDDPPDKCPYLLEYTVMKC